MYILHYTIEAEHPEYGRDTTHRYYYNCTYEEGLEEVKHSLENTGWEIVNHICREICAIDVQERMNSRKEGKKTMKRVFNIEWDTDGDKKLLVSLPTEMEIPDDIETIDEASDYITEETGFCHFGFEAEGFDEEEDDED